MKGLNLGGLLGSVFGSVNVYEIGLNLYKTQGREAARRFFIMPEAQVRSICKKTGADPVKALEERNEAADEILEFLESMVDHDFEDPDDES